MRMDSWDLSSWTLAAWTRARDTTGGTGWRPREAAVKVRDVPRILTYKYHIPVLTFLSITSHIEEIGPNENNTGENRGS